MTLLDNTTYQLQHILKATGQQGNTKAEASEEVVEEILREPVAESQTESKF